MATDYNENSPGAAWVEPPSDYRGEFPYNNITQSESGHFFELDDTPGNERVRLQHRTGTFTEIQSDGKRINKVFGDNFEIIVKDNNVLIKGVCNITILGDSILNVKGDTYQKLEGNLYQSVEGDVDIQSKGDVILNSSVTNLISEKAVNVFASEGLNVHGDLFVSGNINTSQSVNATKNVNAGMKILATMGLDSLGGINCGYSTPGPNPSGVINSTVSMNSPYGGFVLMKANLMTDNINKSLYNIHFHMTPKGPTSPTLIPMV